MMPSWLIACLLTLVVVVSAVGFVAIVELASRRRFVLAGALSLTLPFVLSQAAWWLVRQI